MAFAAVGVKMQHRYLNNIGVLAVRPQEMHRKAETFFVSPGG